MFDKMMPSDPGEWAWFITGMAGQFIFFLRFVVQWVASERKKRTVVPLAFWYLSLTGTVIVLTYAIYCRNLVFILAFSLNILIYARNLYIAKRYPAREAVAERTSE